MLLARAHLGARFLARRTRRDDGMTLVEMLVGISVATVVVLAGFMAADAARKLQHGTTMRIDTVNRGREGMERVTRAIRAQQCHGALRPMISASDNAMEFYASVAPQSTTPNAIQPVQRHRLEWIADTSATTKDIANSGQAVGDIWHTVWTGKTESNGSVTFLTAPTKGVVANDVERAPSRRNASVLAPIFQYYKYGNTTGSGRVDYNSPVPMVSGFAPAGDLPAIVLIEVNYRVWPRGTRISGRASDKQALNFYNTVSVRIADPTNPGGSPQCL